jgi:hypothetical protein
MGIGFYGHSSKAFLPRKVKRKGATPSALAKKEAEPNPPPPLYLKNREGFRAGKRMEKYPNMVT